MCDVEEMSVPRAQDVGVLAGKADHDDWWRWAGTRTDGGEVTPVRPPLQGLGSRTTITVARTCVAIAGRVDAARSEGR